MKNMERTLTPENVDRIIQQLLGSTKGLGFSIKGKTGLNLLKALKRKKVKTGPYRRVALIEAANRIMTDLVILRGVAWLLKKNVFPFNSYTVEFGNEAKNNFDITAKARGKILIGEAFNVAQSLFQYKKSKMLKKLRSAGQKADYRIIMFNHDAVVNGYKPKPEPCLYYVVVNIDSGEAHLANESRYPR